MTGRILLETFSRHIRGQGEDIQADRYTPYKIG